MAEGAATYEKSTGDEKVIDLDSRRSTQEYLGGGGGGTTLDTETKRYVDKSMDTVKAQNDARFSEVLSRIDGLHPATWWQNALLLVGAIGVVFGILAYASDRFDGGISAYSTFDAIIEQQQEVDRQQNARLDRILISLEAMDARSQKSPSEGQN